MPGVDKFNKSEKFVIHTNDMSQNDAEDIVIDGEDINSVETIDGIITNIISEGSDSKKRRLSIDSSNMNKSKIMKQVTTNSNTITIASDVNANSHSKIKIQPVIFFKVDEQPNKMQIEKYLVKMVTDVKIEDFKVTANNNVLIYTNCNEDNEKIVNNINLFSGKRRLNLNTIDRRPYLVINYIYI